MSAKGCILAYWSQRKEAVAVCAERLAQTLNNLAQISPIFSAWSDVKYGSKFFRINPEVGQLTELLSAGRIKTDFHPRKVIEQLGFHTSIRTDDKAWEYLLFTIHCGCYAKEVPNSCIIEFPEIGPHSYEATEGTLKVNALCALIRKWDPDRGAVCNLPFYHAAEAEEPNILFGDFGWVTYVPLRRGELPREVWQKFYIEEVPSFGNLIYLTKEPPQDETNPDYLKMALELYRDLERHGIIANSPC